jgi:hypothetical protein
VNESDKRGKKRGREKGRMKEERRERGSDIAIPEVHV